MCKPVYVETDEKLRVRTHAHNAYASFHLQDWLLQRLGRSEGCGIIEAGCGNGNYFPTYARAVGVGGRIIGLDRDPALLSKARERARTLRTPCSLLEWDFDDHPYPLPDEEVDFLVAPFSAYYTEDVSAWLEDSLRVIKRQGRLLLIGPTGKNARELYDLNEAITGIASVPEVEAASRSLQEQFLPELRKRLGDRVRAETVEAQVRFPCAEEFAKYYFATWLCEKTAERLGRPIEFNTVAAAARQSSLTITKQLICIDARKE